MSSEFENSAFEDEFIEYDNAYDNVSLRHPVGRRIKGTDLNIEEGIEFEPDAGEIGKEAEEEEELIRNLGIIFHHYMAK